MRNSDRSGGGNDRRRTENVVGEVKPFDPGPSAAAAADALAQQGAPFALIGGLALEAWGISRATKGAHRCDAFVVGAVYDRTFFVKSTKYVRSYNL